MGLTMRSRPPIVQRAFDLWLARLDRRSRLSDEDKELVRALPCSVKEFASGRDIVRLEQRTEHSCLVVDGLVGRFGQTRDGTRQITAFYLPGDMGDLHSAVLPKVSAPLQSLKFATIASVPHHAIIEAAFKSPSLSRAFWRDCVVDAQIASEWVLNIGQRAALPRLAHTLCELAWRYELATQSKDVFPICFTQEQMGAATGLTGVHVNRSLRALREAEAIDVRGIEARMIDRRLLASVGGFDPRYLHLEASE